MSIEVAIAIITMLYILVMFLTEAMRPGLILFSAAVIFMASGIITADELISGFSNDGVVTIVVLFLVNEGIRQAGLITRLARAWLPRRRTRMTWMIPRVMVPIAFLSAFLNNLPIVVNVAPLLIKWSEIMRISYRKFLIPLSYAAIFGGMCSLIGTSSNLVVHGLITETGHPGFHLFELAKIGGFIAIFGYIYMSVFGNILLPGRKIRLGDEPTETRDYSYHLVVHDHSLLVGTTITGNQIPGLNALTLNSVERDNRIISIPENPAPVKNTGSRRKSSLPLTIQAGDNLLVTGAADRLNYILNHKEVSLTGMEYLDNAPPESLKQYEVVLSPRFAGLGQTVKEYSFFDHFQAVVLAVHRNGERITANLNNLRLKVGDNVVLLASQQFADNWETSSMFYLVNYMRDYRPGKSTRTRWIALGILAAMVLGIVINELVSWGYGMRLNIFFFVAAAALLLVWLKILPQNTYTKSVSWDLIVVIASALAVSKGLQNTGIAEALGRQSVDIVRSIGPAGTLAVIYLITSILTEIITNNAAVALVFPIALVAATLLGVNPEPFFVAIAIAGASSFITARGYRANLIIKSIGKYSATDFLRIGLPMQIFAFIISMLLIPLFWKF